MPKATQKSAAGLSIELDDNRGYYTVGETVSGNVTLETTQDFAIGSVNIEFYARVKVFYVQSHGQGESHWRGRAPLFSETQLLYEGYYTHKPGSFSWPFELTIPTNPDVDTIKQSEHQWDVHENFLSTDDYIADHPMPVTFDFRKWGWGYRWHCFIEYVLKVEVKQAPGARLILPPASRKATLPVLVRQVTMDTPDTHNLPLSTQFTIPDQLPEKGRLNSHQRGQSPLQTQTFRPVVRATRLLNLNRNSPTSPSSPSIAASPSTFSFREKAKQVFLPNSLPRITYDISVSTPETIKLLKENAIPFIVSASPVTDNVSTTIPSRDYPDIRIDNASLVVTATTHFRCKGPFKGQPVRCEIELLNRQIIDYTLPMDSYRTSVKPTRKSSTKNSSPPSAVPLPTPALIDLSTLPRTFNYMTLISTKMGKQIEKPLCPSFSTYIITRQYTLKWKLELDIAGERVKLQSEGEIPVTVLPPDPEDLDCLMREGDVTGPERHDEDRDEESDGKEEGDNGKANGKGKSKAEEAAEDSIIRPVQPSDGAGPSRVHHDEALPRYEQDEVPSLDPNHTLNRGSSSGPGPVVLSYRHEPDEGPPGYARD